MTYLLPDSEISIAEIFRNVNPDKDGRFLKYVPDGFLNEAQIASKKRELARQKAEYATYGTQYSTRATEDDVASMSIKQLDSGYMDAVKSGDEQRMMVDVDKVARRAGYSSQTVYHSKSVYHDTTVFGFNGISYLGTPVFGFNGFCYITGQRLLTSPDLNISWN